MTEKATLLVDITHPDFSEPVYLMCGSGFDVLRKDNAGRDVYGLHHKGKEYLLFPMDVSTHEAGRLSIRVPVSYEDTVLTDTKLDGARILFSSPYGTPYFAGMPEEYQSNSGLLRIGADGMLFVELDEVDPDSSVPWPGGFAPEDVSDPPCTGEAACDCGGEHVLADDGVFLEVFLKDLPDEKLANHLRKAADELNALLEMAARAGLLIEVSVEQENGAFGAQLVHIGRILRSL